ncbi:MULTISPECIES: TetR/AcrR family transcriptional regulator [unclassified Streptomyces]|uniref:TetR/AcrR family transcriptional regulator n=1 Tax=unclassified Streptomyces TaxID=2593676 RepID=UPI002DDBA2D0|nr:TetR/AcrR family transcriptional regulator [Streptomyces sp. NBC_01788]WSB31014.1 TetR/AcrR family transcriptional regulator [Streptomyces sp. NBC_01788]
MARRAGVGNATLYRHFPTRRDLLVAVCVGEVETLCEPAERLRLEPNPREALIAGTRAYIDHVSAHRGLGSALNTGTPGGRHPGRRVPGSGDRGRRHPAGSGGSDRRGAGSFARCLSVGISRRRTTAKRKGKENHQRLSTLNV